MSIFKKKSTIKPEPIAEPIKEPVKSEPEKAHTQTEIDLANLYLSMKIKDSWLAQINSAVDRIIKYKYRFEAVSKETKCPWHVIACISLLESNLDFTTHLHNGDPLSKRTVQVPAGRPKTGTPPFEWEYSAIDAITYDGLNKEMPFIGTQLYALEKFNGLGSRKHGINSPYLFSSTDKYVKGKYVRDGVWDAEAVSKQVGAASIIKTLEQRGIIKI